MRKLLCLLLCLLVLPLGGCATKEEAPKAEKGKISVVSTIFPAYDFVREIAGDNAELKMLLPFGGESHTYEPTLEDMVAVSNCDLFIYIGGDVDPWAEDLIKASGVSSRRVIKLLDIAGEEHHHEEGDDHEESEDQHLWTSPERVMELVKVISETLCDIDSKNTKIYTENRVEYLDKLTVLSGKFEVLAKDSKGKTLVFADRFPFHYLCLDYGFKHLSALSGCSSDTEPTITAVNNLINKVKEEKTSALLYTETADGNIAKTVMDATGCGKKLLHSCHSVSEEEFKEGETYLSLMEKNLAVLEEVLR